MGAPRRKKRPAGEGGPVQQGTTGSGEYPTPSVRREWSHEKHVAFARKFVPLRREFEACAVTMSWQLGKSAPLPRALFSTVRWADRIRCRLDDYQQRVASDAQHAACRFPYYKDSRPGEHNESPREFIERASREFRNFGREVVTAYPHDKRLTEAVQRLSTKWLPKLEEVAHG